MFILVFPSSTFVTPLSYSEKLVSHYLQKVYYFLSCLFVIFLPTPVGHCYKTSASCGLYLTLSYFHSTQLLPLPDYNHSLITNHCLAIFHLGSWFQPSHTFSRGLLTQVWGWIFKEERNKRWRKTRSYSQTCSFGLLLGSMLHYAPVSPKNTSCDNHFTEQFHQGVLPSFPVNRFKKSSMDAEIALISMNE